MKLAVSNIAWAAEEDDLVYELMKKYGFLGLEIAPTRIFSENPYDRNAAAKRWSIELRNAYGFTIPSIQSIWYGRQEKIFGSVEERQSLIDYTKRAIDFAVAIDCRNLVFGCPRNRNIPQGAEPDIGVKFFDLMQSRTDCLYLLIFRAKGSLFFPERRHSLLQSNRQIRSHIEQKS